MPHKVEGAVPPQEHEGGKERHLQIWPDLATAFGGKTQLPDKVVGLAIAGQINNNGLKFGPKQLDEVVGQICEWAEEEDPAEVRGRILAGIKEQAEGWRDDKQNAIWPVLEAIEGAK